MPLILGVGVSEKNKAETGEGQVPIRPCRPKKVQTIGNTPVFVAFLPRPATSAPPVRLSGIRLSLRRNSRVVQRVVVYKKRLWCSLIGGGARHSGLGPQSVCVKHSPGRSGATPFRRFAAVNPPGRLSLDDKTFAIRPPVAMMSESIHVGQRFRRTTRGMAPVVSFRQVLRQDQKAPTIAVH